METKTIYLSELVMNGLKDELSGERYEVGDWVEVIMNGETILNIVVTENPNEGHISISNPCVQSNHE